MSHFVLEPVMLPSTPALSLDKAGLKVAKRKPINDDAVLEVILLTNPRPDHELGDFQAIPDPVVSPKFAELLKPLDLPGVQYLSTSIKMGKAVHATHLFLYVTNVLDAIDRENSTFTTLSTGAILDIERLSLRTDYLENEVDENHRRLFKLDGRDVFIADEQTAGIISSAGFADIRLIPTEKWNSDLMLDPRRLKKLGLD